MNERIRLSVEEVWAAFVGALCGSNTDPFSYWVPEIRAIQANCEEWWHAVLQIDQSYPIVKFEVLQQGRQGIFGVLFNRGIHEVGFIQKDEQILLTSAKSLRLLDSLSTWMPVDSDNFIFLHPFDHQLSYCGVRRSEEIYRRLLKQMEVRSDNKPIRSKKVGYAICHDAHTLRSLTRIPLDDMSSLTDAVSLTIVSTRLADAHEIAHAVATKHIGGVPPLAYCEGFAECFTYPQGWEEFLDSPFGQPSVFSDLQPAAFFQSRVPWAQAAGFCKYIGHRFGIRLLKDIYRHTNRYTFKAHVLEKTGLSVEDLMVEMQQTAVRHPEVLNAWNIYGN